MVNEDLGYWAYLVGTDYPDRAWLIHPGDVWVKNPHYRGEPVSYPEDQPEPDAPEDNLSDAEADAMTLRDAGMGTDEDYGYFDDTPMGEMA